MEDNRHFILYLFVLSAKLYQTGAYKYVLMCLWPDSKSCSSGLSMSSFVASLLHHNLSEPPGLYYRYHSRDLFLSDLVSKSPSRRCTCETVLWENRDSKKTTRNFNLFSVSVINQSVRRQAKTQHGHGDTM